MKEGQIASETFDVHYYKDSNPDLQEKYGDDWEQYYLHYINTGKKDGRKGVADSSSDSDKEEMIVEEEYDVPDESDNVDTEVDSILDTDLEENVDEDSEKIGDEDSTEEVDNGSYSEDTDADENVDENMDEYDSLFVPMEV